MALDLRRADIVVGAVRAVVAATVLGTASLLFTGSNVMAAPTAVYVGLLALPATVVESWLCRRSPPRSFALVVFVAWLIAMATTGLVHIQAVYATGVLGLGEFGGGVLALEQEWWRLRRPGPAPLHIPPLIFEVGAAGGFAAALVAAALARPLARRFAPRRGLLPGMWVMLDLAATLAGTLVIMCVHGAGDLVVLPIAAAYLGLASAPALGAYALGWVVSGVVSPRLPGTGGRA